VSVIESPRSRTDRAADPGRDPRPAAQAPARRLRVVEPPRDARRTRLVGAVVLLVLFGVLFGTVSFHVKLVQGQQRIDRMERRADAAQARYDHLRLEVDRLSSPARITAAARKLGMVDATDTIWLAPPAGADTSGSDPTSSPADDYLDVKTYLGDAP
jgi:cell division protein FtsL